MGFLQKNAANRATALYGRKDRECGRYRDRRCRLALVEEAERVERYAREP
jgi:hypothetical protein